MNQCPVCAGFQCGPLFAIEPGNIEAPEDFTAVTRSSAAPAAGALMDIEPKHGENKLRLDGICWLSHGRHDNPNFCHGSPLPRLRPELGGSNSFYNALALRPDDVAAPNSGPVCFAVSSVFPFEASGPHPAHREHR